jgi:glycosyltransferase involved in cell wall biosynthesis
MARSDRQAARPDVSVVIPHYQDLGGLEMCLAALERQTLARDRFEIIVSDNNSPVGAAAVEAVVAGRAELVVCGEKGAGPNRNAGVAASRGEILAFIDSDCVAEPEWLEAGLAGLAGFDFVGGRVTVLVDDEARMTATEAFEAVFAFDFESYINRKGFTGAGNMFCSRRVFDAVGGFSNKVSEDVEWSRRATGKGFRLGYVAKAVVGHPARRTWPELRAKWRRVNSEMFALAKVSGSGRVKWWARCLALPGSAVVHTLKVVSCDRLPGVRERALAIGMLFRMRFWRAVDGLSLVLSDGAER